MAIAEVNCRLASTVKIVGRGIVFTGSAGALAGGVVGTFDWPVVGTFFGFVSGAMLGLVTGLADGVILAVSARQGSSLWRSRCRSGLVWGLSALICIARSNHSIAMWPSPSQAMAATCSLLVGAAVGPPIFYGIEPVISIQRYRTVDVSKLAWWLLLGGAGVGGVLGGAVGLVVGVWAYPPTALFAAVEGAVLGVVSGVVVALLVGASAVAPRLRARG